jgi:regulation of enolase protein 1 (concanavalin A-like superfamily)
MSHKSALLRTVWATLMAFTLTRCAADEVLFRDEFKASLAEGWSWVRENRANWRVTEQGLEVRIQPGNMWGPSNNATNVLVRSVPAPGEQALAVGVTVTNRPTEQYEQVNLVWYYDDRHMVKLGQELVDGKLSLVMGREEADRTRTIALLPLNAFTVQLRFVVKGNRIQGEYRPLDTTAWLVAGETDLPVQGAPKVSLQCYQGPKSGERWARFTDFYVKRLEPTPSTR